jgi:hypothetical protein
MEDAVPVAALLGSEGRVGNQVHASHAAWPVTGCGSLSLTEASPGLLFRWALRADRLRPGVEAIVFAIGVHEFATIRSEISLEIFSGGEHIACGAIRASSLASFGGVMLLRIYRHRGQWKMRLDDTGFRAQGSTSGLLALLHHLGINPYGLPHCTP